MAGCPASPLAIIEVVGRWGRWEVGRWVAVGCAARKVVVASSVGGFGRASPIQCNVVILIEVVDLLDSGVSWRYSSTFHPHWGLSNYINLS